MKLHELKTWPVAFEAVERGSKHHEIRKNDRYFIKGDLLQLREWDPTTEKYTGRERTVRVSHISYGGSWDLPDDLCVMSIERRETDRPSTVAALQAVAEAAAPFAHQPFDGDSMRLTDALAALGETENSGCGWLWPVGRSAMRLDKSGAYVCPQCNLGLSVDGVVFTLAEAKALVAAVMGDRFDTKHIDSAVRKLDAAEKGGP